MSSVKILPENVVSKIAGGEVIERPASVVKELVENALDAGAQAVEVHLKEAGKTLILVKDDGSGIARDDLDTIFLRHATSKITSEDDLFDIHSLGFRGEALYAVASVADVTLRSKTRDQSEGWQTRIRGGQGQDTRPAAFNGHGTHIEIKELFFNTPARKKFLKSDSAEMAQVLNTFIPYTLMHPAVRFRLSHNGKDLLQLSPADDALERAAEALRLEPKDINRVEGPNGHIRMLLGNINIKRSRRDMQFMFVNNRPVFSKNMAYHLNRVYRLIMAADEFPFFAVFLNVPAGAVDVNVHPTKREVKIKDEQALCSVLRKMAERSLMSQGQIRQVNDAGPGSGVHGLEGETVERALRRASASMVTTPDAETDVTSSEDYSFPRATGDRQFYIPDAHLFEPSSQRTLQAKLETASYIGPLSNKFLLFESGTSLLVIDQHAAAERITYEKLIVHMDKGDVEVQPLLAPIPVKLTHREFEAWEQSKDELEKCGFSTTRWSGDSIGVHSHPQLLKDPEKAVRQILAGESLPKGDHDTIARRACRSSIMAGDRLSRQQVEFLSKELLKCLDPFTCPHGRPTVLELTEDFLDKQFMRK